MALISSTPSKGNDQLLTIDGNTYEGVESVTFTPSFSTDVLNGITGKTWYDLGKVTYTCTISGFQDFETANSISMKALSSLSTAVTGNWKPRNSGTKSFSFTGYFTPAEIGAAATEWSKQSITLILTSGPTPVP